LLYTADPKKSHLRELEGAQERLTLCKADLLGYESLTEAIQGCDGVFHTASPLTTKEAIFSKRQERKVDQTRNNQSAIYSIPNVNFS
jgi:hypothetical protein